MGCTPFSKSNDNARLLVTFLLNFCHTNPLKSRDKKVLRVSVNAETSLLPREELLFLNKKKISRQPAASQLLADREAQVLDWFLVEDS
jgi:hypothetical protein